MNATLRGGCAERAGTASVGGQLGASTGGKATKMAEVVPPEGDMGGLRKDLERYKIVVAELQRTIRDLETQLNTATTMAEIPQVVVTQPELHQTLNRLVRKVAMIVQSEKCAIMLFQPELGELTVLPPALGLNTEQVKAFRVRATEGVSGLVFREGEPQVFNDAVRDERTIKDLVAFLHVRNGICVPLITKRKDEQERVVEQRTIGVMHVFNKRFGQEFNEDDIRLLTMLADQAAAVISNAQLYIQITEEKEELADTLESMNTGVIVVTHEGEVRLFNPAAQRMLEMPSAEAFQNRPYSEVIDDQHVRSLIENTLNTESEQAVEFSIGSGDGRIFQAQTTLIRGDNEALQNVVAIFNDITDIRNVEQMKTAFVSTVSHELRTPLTSIKGFIATLLEDEEGYYDEPTKREFYEIINQSCDRLKRLIEDLLNISRIEAGRSLDLRLRDVDLRETAERIVQAQQSYTDRHQLVLDVAPDVPQIVHVDQDKCEQILDNLLGNAIKYSPDGGTIKIEAFNEEEMVRFDVTDEGLGVPEASKAKIFGRFEKIHGREHIKGTGIGLYLVKVLAQYHRAPSGDRGDVWLAWSQEGVGSTFSFRLPKLTVDQATRQMEG